MKTRYWVLLLALLLAVSLGLSVWLLAPGEAAAYVEISSQGQVIATLDLRVDQQLTVTTPEGGCNVVTIRDGCVAVTEANCPDGYCMARGFCSSGTQIVCLPNRLVIRFLGQQQLDGVVS